MLEPLQKLQFIATIIAVHLNLNSSRFSLICQHRITVCIKHDIAERLLNNIISWEVEIFSLYKIP